MRRTLCYPRVRVTWGKEAGGRTPARARIPWGRVGCQGEYVVCMGLTWPHVGSMLSSWHGATDGPKEINTEGLTTDGRVLDL